jgi:hypothetical protein
MGMGGYRMTAQTPDTLIYRRKQYEVIGDSGEGLISPVQFNIKPQWMDTGNARGYDSTYSVVRKALVLTKLVVHSREYPPINGSQAKPQIASYLVMGDDETDNRLRAFSPDIFEPRETGYQEYAGLNIKVLFTGGLLAGRNFIDSMYVHMGYQLPHTFKTLLEFRFDDGKLVSATSLSARMAEMRRTIAEEQQAWLAAHQSERGEFERLLEQTRQLRRAFLDGSLDSLSEDESAAKKEAIYAQLDTLENRKHALEEMLRQPFYHENIVKRLSGCFSLDYNL